MQSRNGNVYVIVSKNKFRKCVSCINRKSSCPWGKKEFHVLCSDYCSYEIDPNLLSIDARGEVYIKNDYAIFLKIIFYDKNQEEVNVAFINTLKNEFHLIRDKYYLSDNTYHLIKFLKKYQPHIINGQMKFNFNVAFLKKLKSFKSINYAHIKEDFIIHDNHPNKVSHLIYQKGKGINIKTGFKIPGYNYIVPLSQFHQTPDKNFIKIGKHLYPVPEKKNKRCYELIKSENISISIDDIPIFFQKDLVLLKTHFNAILSEEFKKIKIIEEDFIPRISIDIGKKGWLDFHVEYQVGDFVVPHDLYKKSRKGYLRIDDNTWIKVDQKKIRSVEKELEGSGYESTEEGFKINVTKFLTLEDFITNIGGVKEVSREYQQFLSELTDFTYNEKLQLPEDTEKTLLENGIQLRDYQRAGIHWLNWLSSHYLHGILADDMGLGKTIQSIIALKLRHDAEGNHNHSLIICPRSVVRHWLKEIKRVWPESKVIIHLGPDRRNWRFKREKPRIFITTYATASNDIDFLRQVPFFALILDEGTRIKNPQTTRAKAVKQINALHRLVLSGTPIENRPAELWSIFDFLMKGHLGSYGGFISKIERPILEGDAETSDFLAKRIRPFFLRRLKKDVAKELPEKIMMEEWCELTNEQKSLYGQIQDLYVSPVRRALLRGEKINYTTTILPIITKLKQVCDHPALITEMRIPLQGRSNKFDRICEKIIDLVNNSEQAVLFSHFLGTLDLFEDYLRLKKIRYIRIDGSTRNRQELIDRFNEEGISIALCSLMAAGHGINMTAANHVIHVDRWWNPAREDQATDRVHRIGQFKTVFVHHILTEGTLEEKIDKLLEKKRGISDAVIGAATAGQLQWTREEILELLEPINI